MNVRRSKRLIVVVTTLSSILLATQCGVPNSTLSNRELRHLLANPQTADDHLKIAGHFRAEAAEFDVNAKEHEDLAAYYRGESWQIRGQVAAAHCERVAIAARDAARETRALAALHEDIAKDLAGRKR